MFVSKLHADVHAYIQTLYKHLTYVHTLFHSYFIIYIYTYIHTYTYKHLNKRTIFSNQWMIAWLDSLSDVDDDNYLDVIKGLQVICKLKKSFYRSGETSLTGPRVKDSDRTSTDVDGVTVLFSNRSLSSSTNDVVVDDDDGNASDEEGDSMSTTAATTETVAGDLTSLSSLMGMYCERNTYIHIYICTYMITS